MLKYIVVAGCRNYSDYEEAKLFIEKSIKIFDKNCKLVFLSGSCRGADKLGERYAVENNYDIEYFPAEWSKYGKAAGPLRNKKMADAADLVICFWDSKSRGTKSMIDYAEKTGTQLAIKIIE